MPRGCDHRQSPDPTRLRQLPRIRSWQHRWDRQSQRPAPGTAVQPATRSAEHLGCGQGAVAQGSSVGARQKQVVRTLAYAQSALVEWQDILVMGSTVMTAAANWDIVGPAETDAELARAAAAGDRGAFAGIYDRYADRLHDFCVGMLRDRDGAEDCVQDPFCTAATRLPQLREADKLRPWLYSIARNEALRRIRDRRRESLSDELPEVVSHEPGPDTLAARTELADLITEAAGGLSDRDRSVLELAYRHGLDGDDLADALGVSPANATKMVYRLRETIERSLGALLISRRVRSTG